MATVVRQVTERDALRGAWCVRCRQPFELGQRVVLTDGEPAVHETCPLGD